MNQDDWDYTRQDLDNAQLSVNVGVLQALALHRSKFVRAMVAGNKHCSLVIRRKLAVDSSRGVVGWLIANPSLTKSEFDDIFSSSRLIGDCTIVTPALASSIHADVSQLRLLARDNNWHTNMCILNNYHERGADYFELINQYLAKVDVPYKEWTEIEKLAYYRVSGTRIPPKERGY